jgi:acetylornithine deacetylase/succinyl-diaminopimelate desuccinylase-like protein
MGTDGIDGKPSPSDLELLGEVAARLLPNWIEELVEFCRFRSKRDEPEAMRATADGIEARLRRLGASVERVELDGAYPYVLGEMPATVSRPEASPAPTLLHFNHYDVEVEPPGPDEDWTTPPFEPTIRDGRFYARGVADDKAALLSRIHATELLLESGLGLPARIRFLFEGKQSLGRPVLGDLMAVRPEWGCADGALWENSWTDQSGAPVLKFGEKGILLISLRLSRLERDLSSQNAILLPQAAAELARAVALLTSTPDGSHIPGFGEPVRQWTEDEMSGASRLTFNRDFLAGRAGAAASGLIRSATSPALDIRSRPTIVLSAFHAGPPARSPALGIPGVAYATIEVRLIADQTTDQVFTALQDFLDAQGVIGVELEVLRRGEPEATSTAGAFGRLVIDTARSVYSAEPIAEPCSIWIGTRALVAASGTPVVGIGIGRPDASIDGPDEHIRLSDYQPGVLHVAAVTLGMQGLPVSS